MTANVKLALLLAIVEAGWCYNYYAVNTGDMHMRQAPAIDKATGSCLVWQGVPQYGGVGAGAGYSAVGAQHYTAAPQYQSSPTIYRVARDTASQHQSAKVRHNRQSPDYQTGSQIPAPVEDCPYFVDTAFAN